MSDTNARLPPLGSPWRADLTTNITEQQRAKWRKRWEKMDEDDCQRQHYKHYEWECRKAFEELERREQHLADALRRLAEVEAANRWIPVSESLPDLDVPVDILMSGSHRLCDMQRNYDEQTEGYLWCFGDSHLEDGEPIEAHGYEMDDVTHYRLIPPAPTTDSTPAVNEEKA